MESLLVKVFGFPATLVHGDTLVLDRWRWLKERLPAVAPGSKRLLDVGCGSGGFTIGAARLGYQAVGLSWDERNQTVARQRAEMCGARLAEFEINDVRNLDERTDLADRFDVVVCCENIEHILNDRKLMVDMARCLKPAGTLLLTTPNFHYRAITKGDEGPFSTVEDGGHVRRGYTEADLRRLCADAGLTVREIGYCSGFLSQKTTGLMRVVSGINHVAAWALVLPLRVFPPLLDGWVSRMLRWPGFCITLVAQKR